MALGKTVKQLLAEVDSAELSEWIAFDQVEPLPDPYWQAGVIAATVANSAGGRRGGGSFGPADFMPASRTRAEQTPAEGRAILDALAARRNAGG